MSAGGSQVAARDDGDAAENLTGRFFLRILVFKRQTGNLRKKLPTRRAELEWMRWIRLRSVVKYRYFDLVLVAQKLNIPPMQKSARRSDSKINIPGRSPPFKLWYLLEQDGCFYGEVFDNPALTGLIPLRSPPGAGSPLSSRGSCAACVPPPPPTIVIGRK